MSMNIFLQINELKGSSANPRYPGAIDVDSFTFGGPQRLMAMSQGLNDFVETAPSGADLTIQRYADAASDRILAAITGGRVFPKAVLIAELVNGGVAERRITMTMSNMQFTSFQSGSPGDRRETLVLGFRNIHINQI